MKKGLFVLFFLPFLANAGFKKTETAPAPAVVAPVAKESVKPTEPAETSFSSDDEDSGLPALKAETKAPATAPAAKAVVVPAPAPKVTEPVKEKTAVASVPVAVEKPVMATAPATPKTEEKHQVKQAPVQLESGTDDEVDSGSVAAQQAEAAKMQAQLDAQVKAMQLQMSGQTKAAVRQANQNIKNMNRAMGAGN